jgi:hypothetical protein
VLLRFYAGGVPRAWVTIDASGDVSVVSATQITLDAPVIEIEGELRAQTVSYVPYGGSVPEFLT